MFNANLFGGIGRSTSDSVLSWLAMSQNPAPDDSPEIQVARKNLAEAKNLNERLAAVSKAMDLGMSLHQIESFLDWLDNIRTHD